MCSRPPVPKREGSVQSRQIRFITVSQNSGKVNMQVLIMLCKVTNSTIHFKLMAEMALCNTKLLTPFTKIRQKQTKAPLKPYDLKSLDVTNCIQIVQQNANNCNSSTNRIQREGDNDQIVECNLF